MSYLSESQQRLYEKIYRDLGADIISFLEDDDVNEIMLNPDGKLWIDTNKGQLCVGNIDKSQAFSIIHGISGAQEFIISYKSPQLEAELPFFKSLQGQRFTAQVPPIVSAPSFTIRKKSKLIYTLDDYVITKRMTISQANSLREFIVNKKNILVCGGPGSGKTTVTNALIVEAVKNEENQRFLILEDLPELRCTALNNVSMLTSEAVTMTSLLRSAMRMRPDRILIGEVRGSEALDMLKAWNTGCPGGICTVHANGAEEAIQRILDLAMESGLSKPPINLVRHTIDVIVSVVRQGNHKGFIREVLTVGDYKDDRFYFKQVV